MSSDPTTATATATITVNQDDDPKLMTISNHKDHENGLQGLQYWEKQRAKWRTSFADKTVLVETAVNTSSTSLYTYNSTLSSSTLDMDLDFFIDYLFSREQRWKTKGEYLPFAVPLSTMVDVLVDYWETEGY